MFADKKIQNAPKNKSENPFQKLDGGRCLHANKRNLL
jgi:hypothetical protein